MDVVAHARAIGRRIVVAEHGKLLEASDRHLRDIRQQVVGDAGGILADESALVGADGVEVAQQDHVP